MFYILEGFIFTMLAATMSGMHGRWARDLALPFGMLAERIWVLVPVIFIAVSISWSRNRLGRWHHAVHFMACGCILLPCLIFSLQTSRIALNDMPTAEVSKEIQARFQGQVIIVGGSGGMRAYAANTLDRDAVAQAIFALDPKLKPTNAE